MSSIGQGSISIDDSTRIGENAQDTANKVAGNVNDINSDNKLTPTEKLKLKQEYDKDVELYNIDIEQLKSVNLPTAELETAMSNLTNFVTPLFKEMDRTSTVDRDTLDSVFTAFATADKNASQAFANKVQQVADGAKKAGDDAKKAGEQAQEAGEAAKQAASQAQADATKAKSDAATAQQKAQSSIDQLNETTTKFDGEITEAKTSASQAQSAADSALSSASSAVAKAESTASEFGKVSQKADSAFDNALSAQNDASSAVAQASSAAADSKDAKQIAGAVSQSYKTLTDGSTMTIAELQNGLAVKLTKADLDGYATQDWAQNKIKMTADGINGTMSSIKSTVDGQTTSINDLKADSSSFKSQFTKVNNTLGKQTTDIGSLQASSKELSSNFNSLSTDNNTNKNDISQLKQTATEVSSTLETVQTQVQNSAVGTNLYIDTRDFDNPDIWSYYSVWHKATDKFNGLTVMEANTPWFGLGQTIQAKKGEVYTFSLYARYESGTGNSTMYFVPNGSTVHISQTSAQISLNETWQRLSTTFTVTGDSAIKPRLERTTDNTNTLLIAGLKLERGSKATDYSVSPLDNATVTAVSTISQTVDGMKSDISKKIEQKDLNGYATQTWAQNQIKTTADGINGTISSIKSTVDGQTTDINELKADSSGFKTQFTTVNDTLGKQTTDIGNLQATSKELTSGFNTLTSDNTTNKNDISQLKQTSTEISSTMTTVQTQVQDSAVGTNLLKGTGDHKVTGTGSRVQGYLSNETTDNLLILFKGLEGQTVTVSVDYEYSGFVAGGTSTYTDRLGWEVNIFGDTNMYFGSWFHPNNDSGSGRVSSTFVVPKNIKSILEGLGYIEFPGHGTGTVSHLKLEKGSLATDWCPNPADIATQSQITQLSGEIEQKVDSGDFSTYKTQTDKLIGSKVDNGDFSTYKTQTADLISEKVATKDFSAYQATTAKAISSKVESNDFNTYKTQTDKLIGSKVDNGAFSTYKTQTAQLIESRVDNGTYQSDKTQTADLISQAVKKNDVVNQINISNEGILIDGKKVHITGNTSIDNAVIKNAMIANAAINTAQIADGAINNAKIAYAAIDDAKISNLDGNKIIAGSITANKINVDDLIANGINTKTLTAVNLNASTLTTPHLDLGFNGTFTEDFDYTQANTMFLPKKNKGTLTFNHGVLQSKGNMQTYVGGQWGGMNSNYNFQAGIDNSQWTEVAPGYIKLDLFRQDDANFVERTYIDPTGYYYKSGNGIASYLGNVLQTSQVQTPSLIGKYIGPSAGVDLLQIGNNGKDYGLRIGNYYGGEGVLSDFIYNTTNSGSANIHITENGRLTRSTSASKYKYNIKNPDIETTLGDRLLNVRLATWNDKRAVDSYAEQLSTGKESEKSSIDKFYGLIAEQLRDAGLDMFITYGKNHEIEGIQYDRAWVPLLSVIRRLNDKVNEYELRLSKLEGTNK